MPASRCIEVIILSSDDVTHSSPFALRRAQSPGAEGAPLESTILGSEHDRGKTKGGSSCSWSASSDVFPELDIDLGRDTIGSSKELGVDAEDPISSWTGLPQPESPKATSLHRIRKEQEVIVIGDSPEKPPIHSALPPITDNTAFSSTTTAILADILGANRGSDGRIDNVADTQVESTRRPITRKRCSATDKDGNQDLDLPPTKRKKKARNDAPSGAISREGGTHKKGGRLTEQEREKRIEDKARKAAERDAEKEAKRLEREAKALEKQNQQELDAVNKLKTSKKDSIKEMIVDISTSFAQSPTGQLLVKFLDNQQQENTTDWDAALPNLIKWRRKAVAAWNESLGYFVPIPLDIKDEKYVLVVVLADQFVDMAEDEALLDDHVVKIKSTLGEKGAIPIYLIEGLTALMQKSQNAKNRTFQGAVRQAISSVSTGGNVGSCSSSRRKKGRTRIIDDDIVEDALLRLQITHGCLIHHTTSTQGTLEWIYIFTSDISTVSYKRARMNFDTSFCADVGQVRTGHDADDTFSKMLQELHRVTAGVANGIMAEYKTVRQLMGACTTLGDSVVSDLEIMANQSAGSGSGRKIGQATSKRIHRFFVARREDNLEFC